MERVIVVGAGVVGLSCAVRLLEAGHRVDVLARDLPLETTSAVAAALWYPYLALPQDRVTMWSAATYHEFAKLTTRDDTGVQMRSGTEALAERTPDPWWAARCRPAAGARRGVRRRLVVRRPGRGDAGLPGLAGRARGRARRHGHPSQPGAGCPRGRSWSTAPASAPGCSRGTPTCSRCVARWWWSSRSGWSSGGSPGRSDVRHPAQPRHRGRRHRGRGELEPHPDPETAERILERGIALVPALAGRRCCGTASGCVRCGRRCACSGRATSCTATARAAPA